MLDLPSGLGSALAFLVCIIAHEFATSQAALATGDRTPRMHGRVNLKLKAHADPIGTYILPAVFTLGFMFSSPILPVFGWGKRHDIAPGRRSLLPAIAGPATTLVIAIIAGVFVRAGGGAFPLTFAYVACSLTVIELLPLPGRDGGRILRRFLSPSGASKMDDLEKYEILFLLVLFLFLSGLIGNMVQALYDVVVPTIQSAPIVG